MSKESKIALLLLAALSCLGTSIYRQQQASDGQVAAISADHDEPRASRISARAPRRTTASLARSESRDRSPVLRPPRIERAGKESQALPDEPGDLVDVARPGDKARAAAPSAIDRPHETSVEDDNRTDTAMAEIESDLPIRVDLLESGLADDPFERSRAAEPAESTDRDGPLEPIAAEDVDLPADTADDTARSRYDAAVAAEAEPAEANQDPYDRPLDESPGDTIKIANDTPRAAENDDGRADIADDVARESVTSVAPRASAIPARPSARAAIRSRPAPKARPAPTAPPPEGDEVIVHAGDEFWSISQRLFGTGGYAQAIAQHNRARLPADGELAGGEVLNIPAAVDLRRLYPTLCPRVGSAEDDDSAEPERLASRPRARVIRRTYTVSEGEGLFDIARSELGKADRWVEIYQLNQSAIGDNVDYLAPGLVLTLPHELASDQTTGRPGFYRRR